MIKFTHKVFGECTLRPCPFVSISSSPIRNKTHHLGSDYTITLTGTILPQRGSPIVAGSTLEGDHGFVNNYADGTSSASARAVSSENGNRANSILLKQKSIRELFAYDGMKMSISSSYDDAALGNESIVAYVAVESIDFAEGQYINTATYTITLKASHLEDAQGNLIRDSRFNIKPNPDGTADNHLDTSTGNLQTLLDEHGGFVENFTDEWSIEVDDALGETSDTEALTFHPKTYIITRNVSATGRTVYNDGKKYEAWEQAKEFLIKSVLEDTRPSTDKSTYPTDYPDYSASGSDNEGGINKFAEFVLDLSVGYGGYNHSRTENVNKTDGTVSITDRWVLLQTGAFENYDISIESSNTDSFTSFSINGSIKGATQLSAKSSVFGGSKAETGDTPIQNAISKYKKVSNDGKFDINSFVYKRVVAVTNLSVNPQPLSISVSKNDFTGDISYNVSYNNRPLNLISEALNEQISVQDTYPGDLYSIIPVIGRPTGPVLQYIGGRTEYKRSISINLQFDYTDIDKYAPTTLTGSAAELIATRNSLIMSKPTLIEPIRTQINNVVRSLSPLNEPNIRKCFVDPPNESWEPRTGTYSLNISWTYELSQ